MGNQFLTFEKTATDPGQRSTAAIGHKRGRIPGRRWQYLSHWRRRAIEAIAKDMRITVGENDDIAR